MKSDDSRYVSLGPRQEWFLSCSFSVATEGGALELRPRGGLSRTIFKQAFVVRKRTRSNLARGKK